MHIVIVNWRRSSVTKWLSSQISGVSRMIDYASGIVSMWIN